jgi:hypothetical protein
MKGLLLVGGFVLGSAVAKSSPPMIAFLLSMQAGEGSGTVGLTNTILEVEGTSEVEATYPNPIFPVGYF